MSASSAAPSRAMCRGERYTASHTTSHTTVKLPVIRNAARQPRVSVMTGTMSGVTIAPTLAPALKIPVASARSRFGNHSATALRPAGKLPDSPSPMAKRATMKSVSELAQACATCATVQIATARAYPAARANPVDQLAEDEVADGIGDLEPEHDVAVVDLAPVELLRQRRLENADDLAVDVVERRGGEEQRADDPAEPADTLRRHVGAMPPASHSSLCLDAGAAVTAARAPRAAMTS